MKGIRERKSERKRRKGRKVKLLMPKKCSAKVKNYCKNTGEEEVSKKDERVKCGKKVALD